MSTQSQHVLQDTPLGHFWRLVTRSRQLRYPEEQDGFCPPFLRHGPSPADSSTKSSEQNYRSEELERGPEALSPTPMVDSGTQSEQFPTSAMVSSHASRNGTIDMTRSDDDCIVVNWYSKDDPSNPRNWSTWKKAYIFFFINYCNMVVYMSSSIYAASQSGVMEEFHVSSTVANLGLALFVLGYGFGPLILSPLSDADFVGRNPPYMISGVIFMVLSILAATVTNVESLMVLRFLQGFFGSPILAFGGASLGDICHEDTQPLALYTWACSGFGAASIAPILSSFTVPMMGWRFSLWEIAILNAPLLFMFLITPETSRAKLLHDRTQRLQRRFPNLWLVSALHNNKSDGQPYYRKILDAIVIPVRMHLLDPSIMFTSVYSGLVYGIYYSFFEVLPIVYVGIYRLPPDMASLIYFSVVIGVILIGIPYCSYIYFYILPAARDGRSMTPEDRLIPALISSLLVPSGLFLFAWTSRVEIHWIVPTLGIVLTSAGMVIIIQCVFVYVSLGYPRYFASAMGGNSFLRSCIAFAALLWSGPLYHKLGVGAGSSLLGGCCILGVGGMFYLYLFGARLRQKSRFIS